MAVTSEAKVILKDVEVEAGKVLSFLAKAQKATPGAVAGIAAILGGVGKAIGDVQSAASNPTQVLNISFDQQTAADIKAVWPDIQKAAADLGIKL
jgi:hypothetical protein